MFKLSIIDIINMGMSMLLVIMSYAFHKLSGLDFQYFISITILYFLVKNR